MKGRQLFLDEGVFEHRLVVTLNGKPERLAYRLKGQTSEFNVGTQLVARVSQLAKAHNAAFLEMPGGQEAFLPLNPDSASLHQGGFVEVEIKTEGRRGKLPVCRRTGEAAGPIRILQPGVDSFTFLAETVVSDRQAVTGAEARAVADQAEAEALAKVYPLLDGGSISIEPTRALVAIDVDVGGREGAVAKRAARAANLAGLEDGARLLRLKGLGGLVIFDLAGRGHDNAGLLAAARTAFGPDNPGVALNQISRFGTLELTVPRRARPLMEALLDPDGSLSSQLLVSRMVRAIEREAVVHPGARIRLSCSLSMVSQLDPPMSMLEAHFGKRLVVDGRSDYGRAQFDVSCL
jgi:hypothetical protein